MNVASIVNKANEMKKCIMDTHQKWTEAMEKNNAPLAELLNENLNNLTKEYATFMSQQVDIKSN